MFNTLWDSVIRRQRQRVLGPVWDTHGSALLHRRWISRTLQQPLRVTKTLSDTMSRCETMTVQSWRRLATSHTTGLPNLQVETELNRALSSRPRGWCPKRADHQPVALRSQLNPDERQRTNRRHHHERAVAPPPPTRSTRNGLAHTVTGGQQPPVNHNNQPAGPPGHCGRRDCHHHRDEPATGPPARRAD